MLATADGVYDVTLVARPGGFGPTCTHLVVTLGEAPVWAGTCSKGVLAHGLSQRPDTLVLSVLGPGAARPIVMTDFEGDVTSATSDYDGAWCWPLGNGPFGCFREFGTATWRQR